jgi:RNA polymerase sigma-70 factor (ECF subfamily)
MRRLNIQSRLKRLLRRRGTSAVDAEDLVQEAIVRLFVYIRNSGEVRDADAFLTRTALNLAIDLRRSSRSDRYESEPIELLDLVDLAPLPDEVLAAEQRLLRMRDTLERVNPRTREIFFMHRLQGLSHAEIAEKVAISKSAVEKHIASAITLLAMERQGE